MPDPTPQFEPPRQWIGVLFECCGIYARLWRTPEQQEYRGCCPRCTRRVHLSVAPGGSAARIFRAN